MKGKPVVPPLVLAATYSFESTDDLVDVVKHRSGFLYSRWDNPTVREAEAAMAAAEGYGEAVAFGSGMAAITTSILSFVRPGDRVAAIATYGETLRFLRDYLPQIGVETLIFGRDEIEACLATIAEGVALLFLETPMNPLLRVIDIPPLAETAHAQGAIVLLDATFASPVNLHPVALGVDVTLHSATKYLGGHHDITAGFACCPRTRHERIWHHRRMFGGIMDPMTAYLVWRGMQTLTVRVNAQNSGAAAIAEWLSDRPQVREVHYPGLATHPDHEIASRQMSGYGGMLSFELDADYAGTVRFMDRLGTIKLATSLGGVTSLATQPVTNTHASLSPKEREEAGIADSLVRLSVGLEAPQLLIDDLRQAMDSLQSTKRPGCG